MTTLTIRRSAGTHTISGPEGSRDLSPYFGIWHRAQGVKAERAGDYQRTVVNPVKTILGLPTL